VFEPVDADYERRTRESFARQGIMAHIGAVLDVVQPGHVEISLPFLPQLSQQHGFFHAGVISTIADSAGGYAGFTLFATGTQTLMSIVGRAGVRG